MSVVTEIERILAVKEAIRLGIEANGVHVAVELMLTDYAEKLGLISNGVTVRYIDYDGSIISEQIVESGSDAIPPDAPVHDYLTFSSWNNSSTAITHDTDIGAIYNTTDGKSYLFITVNAVTGLSPVIYLNKATTDLLTVSWGDGQTATSSASGNINLANVYAVAGDYTITIECSGDYGFGNGTNITQIFKNGASTAILTKVLTGINAKTISAYAFYTYLSLRAIMISGSVTVLGVTAFNSCYKLQSVILPTSVTSIGSSMFGNCFNLKTIVISNTLTTIGSSAFLGCSFLHSAILPTSVTSIGAGAFSSCQRLQSITIPPSITAIESTTFSGLQDLQSITIPSSVTSIGAGAFNGCRSLSELILPEGITSISDTLLINCQQLLSITIPTSVTSIGSSAFSTCRNISFYVFNSAIPPTLANINAFESINLLAKIYVPDASVAAYKTATNWITYANYIYPLSSKP